VTVSTPTGKRQGFKGAADSLNYADIKTEFSLSGYSKVLCHAIKSYEMREKKLYNDKFKSDVTVKACVSETECFGIFRVAHNISLFYLQAAPTSGSSKSLKG
jgi:hypothetical protein